MLSPWLKLFPLHLARLYHTCTKHKEITGEERPADNKDKVEEVVARFAANPKLLEEDGDEMEPVVAAQNTASEAQVKPKAKRQARKPKQNVEGQNQATQETAAGRGRKRQSAETNVNAETQAQAANSQARTTCKRDVLSQTILFCR